MNIINVRNKVINKGYHYLVSDYKTRNKNRLKHNGIDLIGIKGDYDIVAIETGIVTYIGYEKGIGGYWIAITTNGIQHRYFHLAKGSIKLKKGDLVNKGDIIAKMGDSGNADIISLHFAIYKNGYLDPLYYLMNENPFNIQDNKQDNFTIFVKGVQKELGIKISGIPTIETLSKTITISKNKNWRHPLVLTLQIYLKSLGYDLGKYGLDGKFGPDMEKIIKEYQKNKVGLSEPFIDGIITARKYTWKSLLKIS